MSRSIHTVIYKPANMRCVKIDDDNLGDSLLIDLKTQKKYFHLLGSYANNQYDEIELTKDENEIFEEYLKIYKDISFDNTIDVLDILL